eukprot:6488173-Amphidinium_carterae.2
MSMPAQCLVVVTTKSYLDDMGTKTINWNAFNARSFKRVVALTDDVDRCAAFSFPMSVKDSKHASVTGRRASWNKSRAQQVHRCHRASKTISLTLQALSDQVL